MTYTCWPPQLELWEQTAENGCSVEAESVAEAALVAVRHYAPEGWITEISVRDSLNLQWSVLVGPGNQTSIPELESWNL